MTTEHFLSKDSTMMDLRNVLEHLKDDARDSAINPSILYVEHKDERYRAQASFALGQVGLIDDLLWALSGAPQQEGFDNPTVRIKKLEF